MSRVREAERALTLIGSSARRPYICRACRSQEARQFHSTPRNAEVPFYQRISETLFGKKKKPEEEKKEQAELDKKRVELAQRDADRVALETADETAKGKPKSKYQVAELVDPAVNKDYVLSSNWQELRRIGGEKWIKKNQDPGEKYVGFMPAKRAEVSDARWARMLRHVAVVEQKLIPGETSGSTGSTANGAQDAKDMAWASISLADPNIKLTIVKRIMQMTGHRIPDPAISNAKTIGDLYSSLKTREPAKKLVDTPELTKVNQNAPNVIVHPRRRTTIHKEKAIGRWKFIEDELIARDLPIPARRLRPAKAIAS